MVTDDKDLALMAMVPEGYRDQLSPTELQSRLQAARLILADADLNGNDRTKAVHDARKLMGSIPLASFFAASSAALKLKSTDPKVIDDIADLARRNPAVGLFYDRLTAETQAQIISELYGTPVNEAPKRRFGLWRSSND